MNVVELTIDASAPGLRDIGEKIVNGGCSDCLFCSYNEIGRKICKLLEYSTEGVWDGAKLLACPIVGMSVEGEQESEDKE